MLQHQFWCWRKEFQIANITSVSHSTLQRCRICGENHKVPKCPHRIEARDCRLPEDGPLTGPGKGCACCELIGHNAISCPAIRIYRESKWPNGNESESETFSERSLEFASERGISESESNLSDSESDYDRSSE
jgi:hypothetical protein